jgi:hypothetical protein
MKAFLCCQFVIVTDNFTVSATSVTKSASEDRKDLPQSEYSKDICDNYLKTFKVTSQIVGIILRMEILKMDRSEIML